MSTAAQGVRQQQKVEELCAAAVRALTGDARLHYRARRLHRGAHALPVHAPHLRTDPERDGFGAFRGAADGMALRLNRSDAALHRRLAPADPVERLMFELLEQLRAESLVPPSLPGVRRNLRERFADWSRDFHRSGLTESGLGLLLYTVSQICWSRLTGEPVLAETEDLIEATRAAIVPTLGVALAGIRREAGDQRAFAAHALAIARIVGETVRAARTEGQDDDAGDAQPDARAAFSLLLDFDDGGAETLGTAATGQSRTLQAAEHGYRIHARQYDREVQAASLVRRALLQELRERLDRRIAAQGVHVARLARELKARLALPQRAGWSFGEEHGRIDGRRLALLVGSPAERRLFQLERHAPHTDCLVSFLVDCSGSMKAHIEPVATLIDILVRALEQAGAATEVLGFTTGAWNGGRARRDWLAAGRPPHPGRLNEVCHLVFKDAARSWRRARADIAALLKADLFREGIDGEAVQWACGRMLARTESRRILVIVSDGSPSDGATNLANDPFYLDNHLKQVVAQHEARRDVEILGIGVGLDLSPFYRHRLAVDLTRPLDNALLFEVARLIGARR